MGFLDERLLEELLLLHKRRMLSGEVLGEGEA